MPAPPDLASPLAPDRQRARVVVGIDLGSHSSGFSYFIRPAAGDGGDPDDGDAAAAAAERVQPIQGPGRWVLP
jgi:hypothetical protein